MKESHYKTSKVIYSELKEDNLNKNSQNKKIYDNTHINKIKSLISNYTSLHTVKTYN